MEFKAFSVLTAENKEILENFLGYECKERFSLTNSCREFNNGKETVKNPLVYYIVYEGEDILAYGELQCVIECNKFYVEFKGEGEAGRVLVTGMCRTVKEYGAVLTTVSAEQNDELLLSAGMKCESVDYMLVYEGNQSCAETEDFQDDDFFEDLLDADGACLHGIYHENGCIAGSCFVTEYEDSVCISSVYTDKRYRRQGFATRLIKSVISKYKGKKIMLHVYGENENAVSLYKKLGFIVVESVYTYISDPDIY